MGFWNYCQESAFWTSFLESDLAIEFLRLEASGVL